MLLSGMAKPAKPVPTRRRANVLAAEAWAEVREALDRQLSPLGLRAIEALAPRSGEVIVDIGCGTGQTVLQLANLVGPEGRIIGVDIAPLLLDAARERASGLGHISFIEGDAVVLDLPDESIDACFSRFGVMAFPEPAAAFANFRRMLKPTGRLAFVCWRSLEENELDLLPLRAAGLEHLLDPTPFSLEDPHYVRATLETAGFTDIRISAHDQVVTSGDLDAMTRVLLKVGPLGRIVRENPELRPSAESRVRAALATKGDPARVALRAATWIVSARA
jgi:SAM-dependent methyltransferase